MVTFRVKRKPIIFRSFENAVKYAEKNQRYVSGLYESQWFLMHDRLQKKYMKGRYAFLKKLGVGWGQQYYEFEFPDYVKSSY